MVKATRRGPANDLRGSDVLIGGWSATAGELELLNRAPDDPSTGDDWLAQVGGHLAKMLGRADYLATLHRINASLAQPLEHRAVESKVGIWDKEQAKSDGKVVELIRNHDARHQAAQQIRERDGDQIESLPEYAAKVRERLIFTKADTEVKQLERPATWKSRSPPTGKSG